MASYTQRRKRWHARLSALDEGFHMSEKVQIEMLMESSGLNHDQIRWSWYKQAQAPTSIRSAKFSGNNMAKATRSNNGQEEERSQGDGNLDAEIPNDPKKD